MTESVHSTFGIIDIGSNTIRMNIYKIDPAAKTFSLLMTTSSPAGLAGYVKDSILSDEGIEKLEHVLNEFHEILDVLQVENFAVFATASLRNINNTQAVLKQIDERCQIHIDLLSGASEGRLSFKGALQGLESNHGMYIDTGGGSTEVVLYDDDTINFVTSMPIGSLNLFGQYVKDILPDAKECQEIEKRVRHELKEICPGKNAFDVKYLAVTGGSMRAVREVLAELHWIHADQTLIAPKLLSELKDYLLEDKTRASRLFLKVKPDRIHTLFCGLLIVEEVAKFTGCQTIQVSMNGVREGYLSENILYDDK